MIIPGMKPRWSDHRDLDFFKSHKISGAVGSIGYREFGKKTFPSVNQNGIGLPYGCTGMSQGKLCADEDGVEYDPADIYHNTRPYIDGEGRQIRDSLNEIRTRDLKKNTGETVPDSKRLSYFSIRAQGGFDWFDAMYLAMEATLTENRDISIGLPWFAEFQPPGFGNGALGPNAVLPMVDIPRELQDGFLGFIHRLKNAMGAIFFGAAQKGYTWHNAVIVDTKIINGLPYLKIDSHQGAEYGDHGFCFMSQSLCNAIFEKIQGTEAFTTSKVAPADSVPIQLGFIEYLVSYIALLQTKLKPKNGGVDTAKQNLLYARLLPNLDKKLSANTELGCALAVNAIAKQAWGTEIGGGSSTYQLWQFLKDTTRFESVLPENATPGCVIISPTGSNKNARLAHGHVGIVGKYGICSNNSESGTFEENYSIDSWQRYFTDFGGLPTLVYRPL